MACSGSYALSSLPFTSDFAVSETGRSLISATTQGRRAYIVLKLVSEAAHERMSLALNPKRAELDLVVELQDRQHGDRVLATLQAHQFDVIARPLGRGGERDLPNPWCDV